MDTLPKDQIHAQESESHENSLFEELQDILSTKELDHIEQRCKNYKKSTKDIEQLNLIEGVIKIMKKEILITKEMLLVWIVRNVEEKNIAKMGL